MAEWVDDSAEAPTVLVADGRLLASAGRDRLVDDLVGIVDDDKVRLVVPAIASGLKRFMAGLAVATQNAASPTVS